MTTVFRISSRRKFFYFIMAVFSFASTTYFSYYACLNAIYAVRHKVRIVMIESKGIVTEPDWQWSLSNHENKTASVTELYRRCLLEKLSGKLKWDYLHLVVPVCLGETIWNKLDVKILKNVHDTKFAILPQTTEDNFDCVEVTLGIGNDIAAEKKLKAYLPKCRFFGADPILSSGQIFKKIGTYFEFAVGPYTGKSRAHVCIDDVYYYKNVETVALVDFIKNYAKIDHIDYLLMDNEGSEYGIFEQLQPGGVFDNFTICQISVEVHGVPPNDTVSHAEFSRLIESTIKNSPFLPFWSSLVIAPDHVHMRTYYLNVRNEYCNRMYYESKFSNWS